MSDDLKYKATERYTAGFTDPKAFYGSSHVEAVCRVWVERLDESRSAVATIPRGASSFVVNNLAGKMVHDTKGEMFEAVMVETDPKKMAILAELQALAESAPNGFWNMELN